MPIVNATTRAIAAAIALCAPLSVACAQIIPRVAPPQSAELRAPAYADVADLVLKSPIITDATIRSVTKLKGADAVSAIAGHQRILVSADIANVIRAPGSLPPRIEYLLDVVADPQGRLPKLKKQHVMLYARPVAGQPNQLQLTGEQSQQLWSPTLDLLTRRITTDVLSPGAPPAITGIGNAFFVAGSLPGEGETQIFLTTADNRPVSLNIISRPGEAKKWAVALSEIVDEAAAPPPPGTLLWYRLACFLPRALPDHSLAASDEASAASARSDYQFVLSALGPCGRTFAPATDKPADTRTG